MTGRSWPRWLKLKLPVKGGGVLVLIKGNWRVGAVRVKRWMMEELAERNWDRPGVEVSIIFVGKDRARRLNKVFRKMSYVPQVLGFPMSREADVDGKIRLGDVVICWPKLVEEVEKFKKSEKEVLRSWLKHGLDNLLK